MLSFMSFSARDERDAALAAVLAQGVRDGNVHPVDALRVVKHEMRRRNTNKHASLPFRSVNAQAVIDKYAKAGVPVPKKDSGDALHADHVHELGPADLQDTITVDDWLRVLEQARIVVVVTAKENYELEQLENAGIRGPTKYVRTGLRWAGERPPFIPAG
jgi:hypothetical protein